MDDLTLVGVHDDGEHVVLGGPDGRRFRLPVDEALRAAVRRDRARLGQLQIEMDGKLRPRDIQARIRAGHSAEEIAQEYGIPIGYIRRYEGPVLAEREYVAEQARSVTIGDAFGTGPSQSLGHLVAGRLAAMDVDAETIGWDAWRAEDGSWTVAVSFAGGPGRQKARWTYDAHLRHVIPIDDEARRLTRDEDEPAATGPTRVTPLRHIESEWIGVIDPPPPVDLLDSLRERRGRRSRPLSPEEDEPPDPVREAIDSLIDRSSVDRSEVGPEGFDPDQPAPRNRDRRDRPRPRRPEFSSGADRSRPPERVREHASERARPSDLLVLPDADPLTPPADSSDPAHAERRTGRKSRRASVPSWDDIVFGSRRE